MTSCRIDETAMSPDDRQLDRLAETIERLRARIAEHEAHIGGHETRTRVILVDPLLRSLGWDTEDPNLVVHEFPVGRRKVDYALLRTNEVIGILEAKALGSQLNDSDWGKYVAELPGLPMVAFTNGNEWRFFRKSSGWQRETVEVLSGESFRTGWSLNQKLGRVAVKPDPNGPKDHQGTWFTLFYDFPPKSRPTQIRVGQGQPKEVKTWSDVFVEVARFLYETNALVRSKIPITVPGGKRYLVSQSPENSDGSAFYLPKQFVDGLWLDGHGGVNYIPGKAVHLLRECGTDPKSVEVAIKVGRN